MNIIMIAPQPFFSARGTPFSVYYRLLTLSELGHHVDLITYHLGEDVCLPGVNIIRACTVPGVKKIRIGPSFMKIILDGFLFITSFLYLCFSHKQYKCVFVHEEALLLGLLYKKIFKMKLIYDMHSSLSQQFDNFKFCNFRIVKYLFSILEKQGIRSSDYVLTICDHLYETSLHIAAHKTPVILFQNTRFDRLQLRHMPTEKGKIMILEALTSFIGKAGTNTVLFYSGTFEHYQGLPMMLESLAILTKKSKKVKMILIGGDDIQVNKLKEKSIELGVEQNVLFTGILHANWVKELYVYADILLSPRISGTNIPLKVYECLASGIPMIATDIPSHTQLLNEAICYLASPNAEDFAYTIEKCIHDKKEAMKRSERAKMFFEEHFGIDTYREKMKKVICEIGGN